MVAIKARPQRDYDRRAPPGTRPNARRRGPQKQDRMLSAIAIGKIPMPRQRRTPPVRLPLTSQLPEYVVLDYAIESPNTVLPGDLLALDVGATVIRNTNLVNPTSEFGDLGGDFWLEPKSILFYLNALNNLTTKYLVACLHVREIDVRKDI